MQNDILKTLTAVINALDSIAVTGQYNRGTLYGSIETLKEVVKKLDDTSSMIIDNPNVAE